MNKQIALILLIIFSSVEIKAQENEQLIFERLEYVLNLKPTIEKKYWKNFDNKQYNVPLFYFTETESYIANPSKDFVKFYNPKIVFKNSKMRIYKTLKRFDEISFHMETSFGINDSIDKIIQPIPIMYCSSFEISSKKIPECKSTEYWATMIIHEYFHGFQFKHKSFIKNALSKSNISEDSLSQVYKNNVWFQEKIKIENGFLLNAIKCQNLKETESQIDSFFKLREQRRFETKSKLNIEIADYENIYETMEGTARYIEFNLQVEYATRKPSKKLLLIDDAYDSYKVFKNYKIENDPWLYTAGKRYFYAIGFNIVRLLDKMNINYKSILFKQGNLTLEDILKNNYKKKNSR